MAERRGGADYSFETYDARVREEHRRRYEALGPPDETLRIEPFRMGVDIPPPDLATRGKVATGRARPVKGPPAPDLFGR